MTDIETRQDIENLVNAFYKLVVIDDTIGHFFTEVVQLDWEKHIPIMYDFWETTLLGNLVYKGNPMLKHLALDDKSKIQPRHFQQWLNLWNETVDRHFEGPIATEAKNRANQIAQLMQFKISNRH